jgi:hypothetical protein
MERMRRLSFTPGTAIALVALFFALGGSAFALGDRVQSALVAQPRCTNGAVRGIAVVTGVPSQGIANLPGGFTGAGQYFGRKFNCTGRAVQARRVEAGVFEVRFLGISGASAVVSSTGDAVASVQALPGGIFRVISHPAGRDDKIEVPFTIVLV